MVVRPFQWPGPQGPSPFRPRRSRWSAVTVFAFQHRFGFDLDLHGDAFGGGARGRLGGGGGGGGEGGGAVW